MKRGDVVTIYKYPIDKKRPEGNARLMEKKEDDFMGLEKWEVMFEDGTVVKRFIIKPVDMRRKGGQDE